MADWRDGELLEANQVGRFCGSGYIPVSEADSCEASRDMEGFIFTVQDGRLQDRLW